MTRSLLAAALLVAMALAGCIGGGDGGTTLPPVTDRFDPATLSPKSHGILPAEEVWVTATDGVRLNNVVFRPDTPEKVPVFVNFSPYWGDTAMADPPGDPFARYMIEEYVPRGYAVVLSALRGTGHSEGCFQIGGDVEVSDAYDVIDALSKMPWSSGALAAGGKSYDSTTQNGLIAKQPHPALRGIFHVSGITDMYRYNAKDGVVYNNGLSFTPRYFLMQGLDEYAGATNGAGSPMDESPDSLRRLAGDLACLEAARHVASGTGTAADGMRDEYWQERDWVSALPASDWDGSVFFVHGLQDWNVKPDHIDPWVEILQQKGNPVLGWLHQEAENLGHVYPMRDDWNETMLRWLDGTLKGKPVQMDELWGFEVQGSDRVWRRSKSWPPQSQEQVTVTLDAPFKAPAAQRIAGLPTATVTVVPTHPDDIARVILFANGTYVSEAVRRLGLSDDLRSPRVVEPGVPITLNLTFFPFDREVGPGEEWTLEVGTDRATRADFFFRPEQVTRVEYDAVEVRLPVVDLGGELRPQPEGTPCFAC